MRRSRCACAPIQLDEYVGQQKAVGKGSWLRAAIEHDVLSSVILYGPAGTGKTTLAHIIANHTKSEFVEVSAVTGTVKDLRRVIDEAKTRLNTYDRRTILFIDEIHRFSKSQQDALLHAVENRTVIMIGATTENPYFEVNSALLSRGRVVELEHLKDEDIATLIERALEAPQGLNGKFSADEDTVKTICTLAAGDARSALTTLELASEIAVTRPDTRERQRRRRGSAIPSPWMTLRLPTRVVAFRTTKTVTCTMTLSVRSSSLCAEAIPDATIYWLARMIDAGEDPKFIARRIMIHASEDVGNADPQALLVAHAAFKSAEVIGYPECRINLAQAALYVCLAPKSNACEASIDAALADIHSSGAARGAELSARSPSSGSDEYGVYKYPHDYPEGWVDQRYLPEGLERGAFWQPAGRGWEEWRVEQSERDRSGNAPK